MRQTLQVSELLACTHQIPGKVVVVVFHSFPSPFRCAEALPVLCHMPQALGFLY